MLIGGTDAAELARTYGTPLVVINVDAVDAAIAALHLACDPYSVEIAYAAKAFICIEFARHLASHAEIGIDVCSLGELVTAERAGLDPNRLTLHGAGKTDDELRAATAGRVRYVVVDGIDELRRLAALQRPAEVILRLNTGIEAHTHAFVRTGGSDTKFGIAQHDEPSAVEILKANPQLSFRGLHAHVGSQIYESAPFVANSHALVESAARFYHDGFPSGRINVGGGFGVQMQPGAAGEQLDIVATISDVARCVRECAADLGMPAPRIAIEPGRIIVGNAGTTLYRVLAIKSQSRRRFVIVDGGIFENPRPAIYGAYHHVVTIEPHEAPVEKMTLCGRTCENDELGVVDLPHDLREGELLAMRTTGAYTFSMSGNYNRLPRPPVAGVQAGGHRLWIRREAVDDVLRNDLG